MASIAAARVAREVLETIGQKKKPSVAKIAERNGYTHTTAYSGQVQETATYRAIIDPAINDMVHLRDKFLQEMKRKDLSMERLDTLAQSVARFTHDIQLLSGKSTENVSVEEDRKVLLAVIEQLRLPPKSDVV